MRIPLSTYRLQFNHLFTFSAARAVARYLSDLGVTDVYASPIFKAKKGSMHGYDVVDHNGINPELGGEKEFRELVSQFRALSMGWIQDIVPNHMAFDSENRILMDVLENGSNSRYFRYFDIEWDYPFGTLKGRVLAPLLGSFYAEALENGEISLVYDQQGLAIRYYDLVLPLKLRSYTKVFGRRINEFEEKYADSPDFISFLGALRIFEPLAAVNNTAQPYDQISHAKRILWDFYNANRVIREFMDANTAYFNGRKGDPSSFDALDELLSEQAFRLSFWKVATEEINYRRFFTINELISLRIEDEAVMGHVHRLVLRLISAGIITGLRVDHIDGLYDPSEYLRRLKEKSGNAYVVVEKILAPGERLCPAWQVQGTTGYDFIDCLNGVFCKRENAAVFTRIYRAFTGVYDGYEDLVANKKRLIIGKYMAGNIDNLANLMMRISENDRYGRDITLYGLKRALVELAAFFPVYRTYIDRHGIGESDRAYINQAIEKASLKSPGLVYELNFIRKFLLATPDKRLSQAGQSRLLDFVMHFQQLTAPIMAKGFEDTALYVYNRLISLNEVGCDPDKFGCPVSDYHSFCSGRLASHPFSLNASSTHDTKRGEDSRQRINVLSELPGEWEACLREWSGLNRGLKKQSNGYTIPDDNDEYFIYQTLVGSFPFERSQVPSLVSRMKEYLVKAVREAKVHTAWIKPDSEYENGCMEFIARLLEEPKSPFLDSFCRFQSKIAAYAVYNSLSQVCLKCLSPGVPDIYQGTELWDFSLVDPDNRRLVDFSARRRMLDEIIRRRDERQFPLELLDRYHTGEVKMFVLHACLAARRSEPELFLKGEYIPLETRGALKGNILAFCRRRESRWSLVCVPLFLTGVIKEGEAALGDVWRDTEVVLPARAPAAWRDLFTGGDIAAGQSVRAAELFRRFPLSLLFSVSPRPTGELSQ